MAQVTSGVRHLLTAARVYDWFQNIVGSNSVRRQLAEQHVRAKPGDRVVDIGCGTALILEYLPDIEYYGFDLSEKYIAAARKRWGRRGSFWREHVSTATIEKVAPCDIVLAVAVVHHLDDDEATRLFEMAHAALRDGGRLVTYDACYTKEQSALARLVVSMDRGQNIRREPEYRELAERVFPKVRTTILERPLRIPYTSIIVGCEK